MASLADVEAFERVWKDGGGDALRAHAQRFRALPLFTIVSASLRWRSFSTEGTSAPIAFFSSGAPVFVCITREEALEVWLRHGFSAAAVSFAELLFHVDTFRARILCNPPLGQFFSELEEVGDESFLRPPSYEEQLRREVLAVCESFPQVEEAFLLCRDLQASSPAILGVLASGAHAEQRFQFVERIAQVSSSFFGSPSAIVVYDDLDLNNSRSWDIFKVLSPLYSRSAAKRAEKQQRA